jgi:hypothetical protein
MTDKMKTGPGTHPGRRTQKAEPTPINYHYYQEGRTHTPEFSRAEPDKPGNVFVHGFKSHAAFKRHMKEGIIKMVEDEHNNVHVHKSSPEELEDFINNSHKPEWNKTEVTEGEEYHVRDKPRSEKALDR